MPARYYVIFYDPTNNTITFPMKAVSNPFRSGTPAFAGMPQFFGGNSEGRTVKDTLQTEVTQESRGTYKINGIKNDPLYLNPDVGGVRYVFYLSTEYEKLRDDWPAARDGNTAEMSRIETLDLRIFLGSRNEDEILERLVDATSSSGAPGHTSETADAFTTIIDLWLRSRP
jgi:hypothetical protein